VGAGDDFCSREHGNQYRLKRGMDRLTETNKISSLMRRRESPRPIISASVPLNAAASHRDFPEVRILGSGDTQSSSLRALPGSFTPRMASASDRYLQPRLPRRIGSADSRPSDSSLLSFSALKTTPVAPAPKIVMPARIPRARAALLTIEVVGGGGEWRGFGTLPHVGTREHIGIDGMAPFRIEVPGADCFVSTRNPRGIRVPPRIGRVQGLTRGFGSRRPARRGALRARPLRAAIAVAKLEVPDHHIQYVRRTFNRMAVPRAIGRRVSTHGLVYPSLVARVNATGIKWSSTVRMGRRRPFNGHMPAIRQWGPLWTVSGPVLFNPRRTISLPAHTMPTSLLVALPLAPVRANGAPHVAQAPFSPQNSPFGYKEYQEK
jgi:hypothetical protein